MTVDYAGALNLDPAHCTKYPTYAYIASSRSGAAVYVHALVKQQTASGLARSASRLVYLQRYLNGAWQNMLSRTTSSTGQFTVGFIQTHAYEYRLYVVANTTAAAAYSAITIR